MSLSDHMDRMMGRGAAIALAAALACAGAAAFAAGGARAFAATGYETSLAVSVYVVDSRDGGAGTPSHRPVDDQGEGDGDADERRVAASAQAGIYIGNSSTTAEGPVGSTASATQTLGIRLVDGLHGGQEGVARVEWSLDGPDVAHGAQVEGAHWALPADADPDMAANAIGGYEEEGAEPVPPYADAPLSEYHDFAGWILNGDASKRYVASGADGKITFPLDSIAFAAGEQYRFEAAWTGKWKTVALDAAGGTAAGFGDAASGIYYGRFQYGSTLALPGAAAMSRDGAVFLGWTAEGAEGYAEEAQWDGPARFTAAWSPILSCQVPAAVLLNVKVEGSSVTVGHALDEGGQPREYAFESGSIAPVYVTDVRESTADFTRPARGDEAAAPDGSFHLTRADRAANLAAIFRGSSLADVRLTISDQPADADGAPQGVTYSYGLRDGELKGMTGGYLMVPPIGEDGGSLPVRFSLTGFKPHEVSATDLEHLTVGLLEYTISFEEPAAEDGRE